MAIYVFALVFMSRPAKVALSLPNETQSLRLIFRIKECPTMITRPMSSEQPIYVYAKNRYLHRALARSSENYAKNRSCLIAIPSRDVVAKPRFHPETLANMRHMRGFGWDATTRTEALYPRFLVSFRQKNAF